MSLKTALGRFRLISLCEGMSYLILLLIAMPLKYAMVLPQAVRIVGGLHGLLFVLYVFAALNAWAEERWSIGRLVMVMAISLVPGGAFWLEHKLRREQQALATAPASV